MKYVGYQRYLLPAYSLLRDSIVVWVLLLASGTQQESNFSILNFQSLEKSRMVSQQTHCRHPNLEQIFIGLCWPVLQYRGSPLICDERVGVFLCSQLTCVQSTRWGRVLWPHRLTWYKSAMSCNGTGVGPNRVESHRIDRDQVGR